MKQKYSLRYLVAILSLLFAASSLCGQSLPNSTDYWYPTANPYLVSPTPEAAAFLQRGVYSASVSTGLPDITFPIYEIRTQELSLPIALSYLSGGIRVTDESGSVGLGWMLDAGGVVNRFVQDLPDQADPALPTAEAIRSGNDYASLSRLFPITGGGFCKTDKVRDRYEYSFNGHHGTFYLPRGNEVLQVPYTENRIDRISTADGASCKGFIITTADGVSYHFQEPERVKAVSIVFDAVSRVTYATSEEQTYDACWYLSKITSVNHTDSIVFSYLTDSNRYKDYSVKHVCTELKQHLAPTASWSYQCHANIRQVSDTPLLHEIRFNGGKVTFTYQDDRRDSRKYRLTGVEVRNGQDSVLRRISFSHSYFGGDKLRLDRMTCSGRDGTIYDRYSFAYYNPATYIPTSAIWSEQYAVIGESLPLFSQDRCGYYNGKINKSLLTGLPADEMQGNRYEADRSFSFPAALTHSLKSVTCLNGTKTEFTYDAEPGDWSRTPALRIKEIQTVDPTVDAGSRMSRIYSYGSPCVWIPSVPGCNEADFSINAVYSTSSAHGDRLDIATKRCYHSHPLYPGDAPYWRIWYGRVEELQAGHSQLMAAPADTVRNVYEFVTGPTTWNDCTGYLQDYWSEENRTRRNGCISTILAGYSTACSLSEELAATRNNLFGYMIDTSWAVGMLKRESSYRQEEGGYRLSRTCEYAYEDYLRNDKVPIGLYCKGLNISVSGRTMAGQHVQNEIYSCSRSVSDYYFFDICVSTGWRKPVSVTIQEYDGDRIRTTREDYTYGAMARAVNPHSFVTAYTRQAGGLWKETHQYQYPLDADSLASPVKERMIAAHCISPVISDMETDDVQGKKAQKATLRDFVWQDGKLLLRSVSVRYGFRNGTGTAVPFSWGKEYKTTALAFDRQGRPLWISDPAGLSTVYLWNGQWTYPVAEIRNATPEEVRNALGLSGELEGLGESSALDKTLNRLRAKLPQSQIYQYTYIPLVGKSSETAPDGTTTRYTYDSCGRLREVFLMQEGRKRLLESYEYHHRNAD